MKKLIGFILGCLLFVCLCTFALADVEINGSNFPDPIFREVMKRYDTDSDNRLSDQEISLIRELSFSVGSNLDESVKSLTGVEFLSELRSLAYEMCLAGKPDLRKNTKLENLNCAWSCTNSLDLSNNRNLKVLNCGHCIIHSLDLRNNTALTELICDGCYFTSLNLKKNTSLVYLNCSGNDLKTLSLPKSAVLRSLDCRHNSLSEVNISQCTILNQLVKEHEGELDYSDEDVLCWSDGDNYLAVDLNTRIITDEGPYVHGKPAFLTIKGGKYELNKDSNAAVFTKPASKNAQQLIILNTVRINDKLYRVNEIRSSACKGMKKLTAVTVGKYIARIGKSAFSNCKKLNWIKVLSTKLEQDSIGSGCFNGIDNAIFEVPVKMLKKYKSWFVKSGKAPASAIFQPSR